MWRGFGDGLSQAVEMALVPPLFALGGLALDKWLGLVPVLTVTLAVVAMVGMFARAYYAFSARAQDMDEGKVWARRR